MYVCLQDGSEMMDSSEREGPGRTQSSKGSVKKKVSLVTGGKGAASAARAGALDDSKVRPYSAPAPAKAPAAQQAPGTAPATAAADEAADRKSATKTKSSLSSTRSTPKGVRYVESAPVKAPSPAVAAVSQVSGRGRPRVYAHAPRRCHAGCYKM